MSDALKKLAAKVVRRQIEEAKPTDVDAVAALITFDVTELGDIIATDKDGVRRVGRSDGFHMSLTERIEELATERPALFGKSAAKPATNLHNPFLPGSGYSMTSQMLLWRSDPEEAETLAAEAGLKINRSI